MQADFDQWWPHYPRKVSKGRALKAFPKALKLAGSLQVLIDGAIRLAQQNRDWQFIPYPATWLNDLGWEDQEPPKKSIASDFLRDWEYRQRQQWADDVRCPPRKEQN